MTSVRVTAKVVPLLPPRPNPGPEPWPEPASSLGPTLALALAIALGGVLVGGSAWWIARRWARRRPNRLHSGPAEADPESPGSRWVAWSEAIRAALVARGGPGW